MKTPYLLYITIVSALLATTSQTFAQNIVVGWGGDTVSQSQDLVGFTSQSSISSININPPSRAGRLLIPTDTLNNDAIVGIPFNETTALSPDPNTGYTGQRFYGGLAGGIINPGTGTLPTIDRAQVSNQGNNDNLDFQFQLNNKQHDSRLAVFFNKPDFLAGGASNAVKIGASSTLSVTFKSNTSSQVNGDGELRWLVREAGQWWISAANSASQPNIRSADDAGSGGIQNNTTFASNASQLQYWAQYNPLSPNGLQGLNFEPSYQSTYVVDPITTPFGLHTFSDITGLGFYLEGDQFSTNVFQFEVSNINFSMLVVPEPSTYALMGLTGFFALQWYLRRKRIEPQKPPETGDTNEMASISA